jgi:hypothetical protein
MRTQGQVGARWEAQPVRAALLRAAAFAVPLGLSVAAGVTVGALLPRSRSLVGAIACWTVVLVVSTLVLRGVDRWTRRLLPVATLLKLSMLFPDRAPSRYKIARSVAGTRALAAELERARSSGVSGNRQQAAETILALVGALGDYDSRTRGHSERTQLFVTMLADEMKLKQEDRDRLLWAALVHDIGKLHVPGTVLNKPGRPDAAEWEILRRHPADGATICAPLMEWLGPWGLAIEQHHERYDGTGYPLGLKGEEIGLAGRMVAVADSYEVMTAARAYKKPMTPLAAREELTRCAGTQFDPAVVRAFLAISLGRMRWVTGPLAWLAQLPFLRMVPSVGPAVGTAATGVLTGASLIGLGVGPLASIPAAAAQNATGLRPPSASRPVSSPTPGPGGAELPTSGGSRSTGPHASGGAGGAGGTAPTGSPTALPRTAPSPTTPAGTTPSGTSTTPHQPPPTASQPPPTPTPQPDRPPVAKGDSVQVPQDASARTVDVLANDSDPDHDPVKVSAVTQPPHGRATFTAGSVRYTPDAGYHGGDSFRYTVSDGRGGTDSAQVTVTVTPAPVTPSTLYLRGGSSQLTTPMTAAAPTEGATDWDRDGHPGLTIKSSDLRATEPDTHKFQTWSYSVPAGGLSLHGPMSLSVWSSPRFRKGQDVDYSAWVYDCDDHGSTCRLLTSVVKVHVKKWSTTTTWERRTVPLGTVSTSLAAGRTLRVRLAFGKSDIWLPLDQAHPSSLTFSG